MAKKLDTAACTPAERYVPMACSVCTEPGDAHGIRYLKVDHAVEFGVGDVVAHGPWVGFVVTCSRCGFCWLEALPTGAQVPE